jgi:hypothetical protein
VKLGVGFSVPVFVDGKRDWKIKRERILKRFEQNLNNKKYKDEIRSQK